MYIDHNSPEFQRRWQKIKANKYNGGYYCSKDIVEEIIPRVQTDRAWITVNVRKCCDHSIFFVHNYLHPEWYDFIKDYKDVVLVFHHNTIMPRLSHLGKQIILPTFINTDYVKQFAREKDRETAYVGRKVSRRGILLPEGIDYIENMPRESLLKEMARYKNIYAIGRTALEGKALGCNILPYDPKWSDPNYWQVFDVKEAAKLLQDRINRIDGVI